MLNFFSLIIKVSITLLSVYAMLFFSTPAKDKDDSFKVIILTTLLISSFLSIIFLFSNYINDYTIFISVLFICSLFIYSLSKNFTQSIKFVFYFIFCFVVGISIGYILHSLLILVSYYYIKNNFDNIKINEQNQIDESFNYDDNE